MKSLSTLDTLFLTLDTERFPLPGVGLLVLDPSTAPKPFSFEVLKKHIRVTLPKLPLPTRRARQLR